MADEIKISEKSLEKIKSVDLEPIYRNKTMVVGQYTFEAPKECIILDGLKDEKTKKKRPLVSSMEELFNEFKPHVEIQLDKNVEAETLHFMDVNHFLPEDDNEGFINQSVVLSSNQAQCKTLGNFQEIISEDDDIYEALNNSDSRKSIIQALDLLTQILNPND